MYFNFLQQFFSEFDYPNDARSALIENYQKIYNSSNLHTKFVETINIYEQSMQCDFDFSLHVIKEISIQASIHEYSAYLLYLICLTPILKRYYISNNFEEKLWKETVFDWKYKAVECNLIYNVWGTFVPTWFCGYLQLKRFGIGRLQFEIGTFPKNYSNGIFSVEKNQPVIDVHIPRTGERLNRQETLDSYKKAAEFFKERFNIERIFVCHSWLLFPPNKTMLKDGSNLKLFMDDFDIIEFGYDPDYSERWRLFDSLEEDPNKLPSNSSLRRAYIELMKRGDKMGWGYGVFCLR